MTRSLPDRPNLESDRKRAKALKKAHAAGDPEALERIRSHHPRFRGMGDAALCRASLRLADAQLVVAREYGAESWPRWVALAGFLNANFDARVALLLEAALGESPERANDLLARAPELGRANLLTACAVGDADAALAALARDPAGASRGEGPLGATALYALCWSNTGPDGRRAEIAEALVAAGADPNTTAERASSFGVLRFTALYGAVARERPEILEVLLRHGADPNDEESVYHAAEHEDARCLGLLLARGAATQGTNALHRALDTPHPAPLRALLDAGADANALAEGVAMPGRPLHHAALRARALPACRALVDAGADLDGLDAAGRTPFQVAQRFGNAETADALAQLGADTTLSPRDAFCAAASVGDATAARALLDREALHLSDLDAEDHALLPRAAERGRVDAVRTLLDLGFPIEATGGDWSGTALNHAAHGGHPDCVALLLERGAELEGLNEFEGTVAGALIWSSTQPDGVETFAPGRGEAERQRDLVACLDLLARAGAVLGPRSLEAASPTVADALREHGVQDG